MVCGYGGRVCLCLCVGVCVWAGGGALSCRRTFDVVVDDVVGMQVFQASEHMLGHPNDLKLPHGPTAVELLQDGAALARLHEQVQVLVPQHRAVQLSDVLVTEARLDLHVGGLEVLYRDLGKTRHGSCLQYAIYSVPLAIVYCR